MNKLPRLVALVLLCSLVASCGGGGGTTTRAATSLFDDLFRSGDDLVRSGASQADGTVNLPHMEVPVPAGQVDDLADDVGRATAALPEQHVAGLSEDDAKTVIDYACKAEDLFDDGKVPTMADAVEAVVPQDVRTEIMENVEKLAEDLAEAQTSADRVEAIAGAAVCQYVGLPAS